MLHRVALFTFLGAASLLSAAQRFMRHTPGSTESPLLVSSTALGLGRPLDAQAAIEATDRFAREARVP